MVSSIDIWTHIVTSDRKAARSLQIPRGWSIRRVAPPQGRVIQRYWPASRRVNLGLDRSALTIWYFKDLSVFRSCWIYKKWPSAIPFHKCTPLWNDNALRLLLIHASKLIDHRLHRRVPIRRRNLSMGCAKLSQERPNRLISSFDIGRVLALQCLLHELSGTCDLLGLSALLRLLGLLLILLI